MALICLATVTICFAGKNFDIQKIKEHQSEIDQNYGEEVKRLRPLCAQKFYRKTLGMQRKDLAEEIAKVAFSQDWKASVEKPIERYSSNLEMQPLMKSLVWCHAKNKFIDEIMSHPTQRSVLVHWFLKTEMWRDAFIDSDIEESAGDSERNEEKKIECEVVREMSKKLAKKMAKSIALALGSSEEERDGFNATVDSLLKDEIYKRLNSVTAVSDQGLRGFLNSLNVSGHIGISESQKPLVEEKLRELLELSENIFD